ncbi:MAG: hypothetical protein V4735_04860 [Pseudomonadota bacterium]
MSDDKNNKAQPNANLAGKASSSAPTMLLVKTSLDSDVAAKGGLPEAYEKLAKRGYDMHVVQPWTDRAPDTEAAAIPILVDSVRQHIKRNGSLDELRFVGHGATNLIGSDRTAIGADTLLKALVTLQQELGQPIAKKIIFDACSVFKELTPEQVKTFRTLSTALNAEIVGTRDYVLSSLENQRISFKNGKVGHFTPDDEPSVALSIIQTAANIHERGRLAANNVWIECHTGRPQETGELCQKIVEPVVEATGHIPLLPRVIMTSLGEKALKYMKSIISTEKMDEAQKGMLNEHEREILRKLNSHPAPTGTAGGMPILLSGAEMSRRADDILEKAGLGGKDTQGNLPADHLRNPKTRDAYMDGLRNAYDEQKDPIEKTALHKKIAAAQEFCKMDEVIRGVLKFEQKNPNATQYPHGKSFQQIPHHAPHNDGHNR